MSRYAAACKKEREAVEATALQRTSEFIELFVDNDGEVKTASLESTRVKKQIVLQIIGYMNRSHGVSWHVTRSKCSTDHRAREYIKSRMADGTWLMRSSKQHRNLHGSLRPIGQVALWRERVLMLRCRKWLQQQKLIPLQFHVDEIFVLDRAIGKRDLSGLLEMTYSDGTPVYKFLRARERKKDCKVTWPLVPEEDATPVALRGAWKVIQDASVEEIWNNGEPLSLRRLGLARLTSCHS